MSSSSSSSQFMNCLKIYGYNEEFGYNMMKGILEREIECERLISKGERVRYRSGEQIRSQKNTKLGTSNNTWYLGENGQMLYRYNAHQTEYLDL